MIFQASLFSLLVTGLQTNYELTRREIVFPRFDLSTKYCKDRFGLDEHTRFKDEYRQEVLGYNGGSSKKIFSGYIGVWNTKITATTENCSILDGKECLENIWSMSYTNKCSYSEMKVLETDCKCTLDYSYSFGI